MSKENTLVKLLSKPLLDDSDVKVIKSLLKEKLNWAEIIGWLFYHRTIGTCWKNLNEQILDDSINQYSLGYLYYLSEQMYKLQVLKAEAQNHYNKKVFKLLDNHNIDYVVLKGMALSLFVYKDTGVRNSNDCDLLIEKKNISKVLEILKEEGYIQGKINVLKKEIKQSPRKDILLRTLNSHEIFPLTKKIDKEFLEFHRLDIHFSINLMSTDHDENLIGDLLNNKLELIHKDSTVKSLNWDDLLLFLCIHFFREATSTRDISNNKDLLLYKICDIYALVNSKEINWQRFKEKAGRYNFITECYGSLLCLSRIYGGVNKEILENLRLEYMKSSNYKIEDIHPWINEVNENMFDFYRYEKKNDDYNHWRGDNHGI